MSAVIEPLVTATEKPRELGRPFGAQLASTAAANLGDGIVGTFAPLVALSLTTSPAQISLLSAAVWLPWLMFGIAAGVVIDRTDRRHTQIVALMIRAGILAAGAWLGATGTMTMPWLLGLILAYGITEVFADLAASSMVPDLVPRSRLAAANGRTIGAQQVTNAFLGAPLAGALILVGVGVGFGISAGLAGLAALVLTVGIKGNYRPALAPDQTRPRALAQVKAGLTFLFAHDVLRPMVITSSVLNFASTAYFAVFILWAVGPTSAMGLTEPQYPLLMLGFATGAVIGSLIAERVQNRLGEIITINVMLTTGVVLMLVPLLFPNPWIVAVGLTVVGVTNTIGNVVSQSLRQRLVPQGLLGRVGGASRTLGFGLMPLGAILGGLVAEAFGLPATFVGAIAVSVAACAYLALRVRSATVVAAQAAVANS